MRKNLLPLLFSLSLFSSCVSTGEPLATKNSDNNRTYKVDYLFEHDGCKVYRFYDYGYVYFTNCNGETFRKGDSTETRSINRKKKSKSAAF